MDTIAYLLPALGCAAMMGGMIWMMRGSNRSDAPRPESTDERQRELSELRAEIDELSTKAASDDAEVKTTREQDS